jgi:predicted AAA+ superfamily ATPase
MVNTNQMQGPRIIATGRGFCATASHGDSHNCSIEEVSAGHPWAEAVDGPWELRKAVRRRLRECPDAIKIWATGGGIYRWDTSRDHHYTFEEIKAVVDESHERGAFWLSGSQQFRLMKGVSESLAGRVGVLQLQGFSLNETAGDPDIEKFVPTTEWIEKRASKVDGMDYGSIFHRIWRGNYPALYENPLMDWEDFYSSYVQTYVERDVRELINIGDELAFTKFITAIASRTGQLLNYSDVAKDIGKNVPTVQRWLSLLIASGLVYLLYPYAQSIGNRMTKMPKVYFLDTGLACYLTRWTSPEVLESGAKSGEMLETFVVSELLKTYWHNGRQPNFSFYRDKEKREIDLIVEDDGKLCPVEIKQTSNPTRKDIRHFDILEENGMDVGCGAVICLAKTHLPLTDKVNILPLAYL